MMASRRGLTLAHQGGEGEPKPVREESGDPSQGQIDLSGGLGVYVHFPFCSVHCPYCDFAVDVRNPIPHAGYADAVIAELDARRSWFAGPQGGSLRSIYFGGGTPGLWAPAELGRVVRAVRSAFSSENSALEITVEANPGELTPEHAAAWAAAGVNRLSLGAQSFDDEQLGRLGRNHDTRAIPLAFAAAREAGFDNIACDLMFGLPTQSLDSWRSSMDALVAMAPEHVSAYALTVERGTPFGALDRAGKLPRPDDDLVSRMFEEAQERLGAAGYEHYEVSSYARAGRRAVHNTLYWTGGAYLGLGASAASFRPLLDGTGWRFSNPRSTTTYLRGIEAKAGAIAPAKIDRRSPADQENEALWLGLRLCDGVDRAAHRARFGADPLSRRAEAAQRLADAGWLVVEEGSLRLTRQGFLFADEVASRLWLDT